MIASAARRGRLKNFHGVADVWRMKSFSAHLILLVLLLATSSPLLTQKSDESSARSKILALEHAWNQAEELKDLKALDAIFDSELTYVTFDGVLLSKSEFLVSVKSAHIGQVVTESMNVQLFGDTAIVTGIYRASDLRNGQVVMRHGRFLDTWIYKNASWVCIAADATPFLNAAQ